MVRNYHGRLFLSTKRDSRFEQIKNPAAATAGL